MTAKARLDVEVAELKRMLAKAQSLKRDEDKASVPPPHAPVATAHHREATPPAAQPGGGDLELMLDGMVDEVKGLYRRHPLVAALGAVAVGFLIGRRG